MKWNATKWVEQKRKQSENEEPKKILKKIPNEAGDYAENASAESDFCECFRRVHIHEHERTD